MKVTTETTEEQTKGLSAKIQNDAIQEFNPRFSESAAIRRRAISIPVSLAEIEFPEGQLLEDSLNAIEQLNEFRQ